MSRYIDADELVRYMEERQERLKDDESLWELSVVETFLGRASSADVVEVKHGEWIYGESEEGHDGYRCSECGEFIPWEYDEYDVDFIKEAHYCPNCGARMYHACHCSCGERKDNE